MALETRHVPASRGGVVQVERQQVYLDSDGVASKLAVAGRHWVSDESGSFPSAVWLGRPTCAKPQGRTAEVVTGAQRLDIAHVQLWGMGMMKGPGSNDQKVKPRLHGLPQVIQHAATSDALMQAQTL